MTRPPRSGSARSAGTSTRRGLTLLEAGRRADRLGYDTLWTWDHLYPIVGSRRRADPRGLADPGRLGAGHRARPDRPDGRCQHVPRTGAHGQDGDDPRPHLRRAGDPGHRRRLVRDRARGVRPRRSADGFPERLRWLGEALPIMRGMLHGERPTAAGPRYATTAVRNDPPPIQERLPILIGGGGEQVTLKLVARYGDANNVGGGLENVKRKEADPPPALRDGGPRSGRDRADDRASGTVIIRDSRAEAERVQRGDLRRATADAELWTGPAGRHARGRRRATRAVPRDRLSPPDRGLPGAARRGVDDPARDRGPAVPGASADDGRTRTA